MNSESRTANLNKTTRKPLSSSGFTLIEILVVTAILGIMLSVAANVIITILRNQNKANLVAEIRQNADLVINTFERDVRSAKQASITTPAGSNQVTLTLPDDTAVVWSCTPRTAGTVNGRISRSIGGGPTVSVTNTDTNNGVSVTNAAPCNIFSGDSNPATAITLNFTLRQGETNPNKVEFSTSDVQFKTTVGPRATPR